VTVAGKRRNTRATSSSLKPFYIILGIVAVVGLGALALALRGGDTAGAATAPVEMTDLQNPQELVARARGVAAGPADAPVQVIVFSDYMCPYCADFARGVEQQIKAEYVATGRAQFVYYDFPLGGSHVHSFIAARAGRCAEEQERFWEYHDLLLGRQTSWMYERSVPMRQFNEYARELGLDEGAFRECLNSDRHADLVTANYMLGNRLGVGGTPTVFINGRRVDRPLTWTDVRDMIEQQLGS
jgi:protein-disulfide isomerase